jgi:hypothetical protein
MTLSMPDQLQTRPASVASEPSQPELRADEQNALAFNLAMERVRWLQFGASAVLKAGTVAFAVLL